MFKVLTVIVPTYNMERYLRKNLDSFCVKGVMDDVEVIVVNDGSTDSSAEIAEEYVQQYPNVFRLINKNNGGHGSTINTGIIEASGRYFKVVDADDWVEREAFCKLINELKKADVDIVYSNFYWVENSIQPNKKKFRLKAEFKAPFEGVKYGEEYDFNSIAGKLYIKMHNMTIKTEILKENDIKVDENCYYVDTEYILYPIPYVRNILFIPDYVYMYRIGREGQSISVEALQKNEKNYDKVIDSLLEFYKNIKADEICSSEKLEYIAGVIARVIAGKIKIILSYQINKKRRKQLQNFDRYIREQHVDIFDANKNCAVTVLRRTGYIAYYIISILLKLKKWM